MDARYGAIVLCGGESTRMGQDKAWLPFGGETLLERIVRIVGKSIHDHNIVVVAGPRQELPSLPPAIRVVRDAEEARGPLPALLDGLCQLPEIVEAAFVTACDAPLLKPAVIEWLLERLALVHADDSQPTTYHDALVPTDGRMHYPLCAAFRTTCRVGVAAAPMHGITSLQGLLRSKLVSGRTFALDDLRDVDPQLDSLVNCNTPEEYERALRKAGFDL
jgi:molybdopterin-guanine dinucleotide biosynthesis protein A